MLNHEDLQERETHTLSRLALRARDSRGRRVPEEADPLRTCYQRDRDRVLHNPAFRRLQQKTQVFHASEGDHFRTRLTHTLEVSQLARSACLSLELNGDVAEAVALAHDLGHPPFGHVGERALHERMREHGGFRHNAQGLRIVDELADAYPNRSGLNLCWETRLCLLKSKVPDGFPIAGDLPRTGVPFLEGQLVDLCDRAAYVSHDVDDAIRAGLVSWTAFAGLALPGRAFEDVLRRYPTLQGEGDPDSSRLLRRQTVSTMLSMLVRDIVLATDAKIDTARSLTCAEDVRRAGSYLACHTQATQTELAELLKVLRESFYRHKAVLARMDAAAAEMSRLFERFVTRPEAMPPRFQARIADAGLERTVCDYVSGMTDRYVARLAEELSV